MPRFVALFRGINVGGNKEIAMPALRELFEGLGFTEVVTVLRSGNVVFTAERADSAQVPEIEEAVAAATGVRSSVLLYDRERFAAIVAGLPFRAIATSGSRLFVTFLSNPPPDRPELPDAVELAPELLQVGPDAVYQWMPDGSQATKVPRSFWRQFVGPVTARNANTVDKLHLLLS